MICSRTLPHSKRSIGRLFVQAFSSKHPLNLGLFRTEVQLEIVRESLRKRFRDVRLADRIAQADKKVRSLNYNLEQHRKQLNRVAKELGKALKSDGSVLQEMKDSLAKKKEQQKFLSQESEQAQIELEQLVNQVGNIVHGQVPVSQDEEHNAIRHIDGTASKKGTPYWTVLERLDAVDMKRGQKLSGHRGYFLKGAGVKLSKALANLSLDFLEKQGYTLFETPLMIREELMRECCQLSDLEKEMYKLQGQDTVLIATSEQSLACMYRQETLQRLPVRMAGFSTCFRKEAGAHGKDNQGLFRVHQFEKAEQFVICKEEDSETELQRMIQTSMKFYREVLPIPYRVVEIVSGALNDAATRKYDLEAWFPHANRYRELVSVSNCTDYQSRMLEVRYRQGQQNKYAHMLNGTLCAIQRTMCCLLENYAEEDGVHLPEALATRYGSRIIPYSK